MPKETTYAGIQGQWQALSAPLAEKPPRLEHLEPFRVELSAALNTALDVAKQQSAPAAKPFRDRKVRKDAVKPAPSAQASAPQSELSAG